MDSDYDEQSSDDFYFDDQGALDDEYDIDDIDDEMDDETQITEGEKSIRRQEHLAQIREMAAKFKIRREFNWNHQKVLWVALKNDKKIIQGKNQNDVI